MWVVGHCVPDHAPVLSSLSGVSFTGDQLCGGVRKNFWLSDQSRRVLASWKINHYNRERKDKMWHKKQNNVALSSHLDHSLCSPFPRTVEPSRSASTTPYFFPEKAKKVLSCHIFKKVVYHLHIFLYRQKRPFQSAKEIFSNISTFVPKRSLCFS